MVNGFGVSYFIDGSNQIWNLVLYLIFFFFYILYKYIRNIPSPFSFITRIARRYIWRQIGRWNISKVL